MLSDGPLTPPTGPATTRSDPPRVLHHGALRCVLYVVDFPADCGAFGFYKVSFILICCLGTYASKLLARSEEHTSELQSPC